jgi:ubiquinone/menaquinone biosynthesis C-methylase UbiE
MRKLLEWFGLRSKAPDPQVVDLMRREWDERARQNARHYVATLQGEWTDEEFFESGSIWVRDYIENSLAEICNTRLPADMRVLEIGCGTGRMTVPLSRIFGHVDAVDISAEMIARARTAAQNRNNIRLHVNNGVDLSMFADEEFDFVLSAIVFQHIPKRIVVENYVMEAWRVLRPGSLFKFQVQGFPIQEEEANTWVGVGFSEEQISEIARRNAFKIRDAQGARTQFYWLTFEKV